jgi:hypothetical protein
MVRSSSLVRSPVLLLAFAATFVAGVLSQRLLLREAHADPASSTASLYVPPSGLVFRTLDGTPIARISRGAHGGVFEVYDDQQQPIRHWPASGPMATPTSAIDMNIARDPGF